MKLIRILILVFIFALIIVPKDTKAEEILNPTRVVFIQNGGTVIDPNWNNGVIFVVEPYSNTDQLNESIQIARSHFDIFNLLITTDEVTYNSFDSFHRTKIIVGNTNILGPYTGYSLNNSYLWGDDTPAFVLVNNCNPANIVTDVGHLIAHELGHVYGLEHKLNPDSYYSIGYIMSNFTGKKFITWGNDDITALTPILGLKDPIS